jgi:hypothetical protein
MTPETGSPIPLVDGVFKIVDGRPVLLVSRCSSCNERSFPPRDRCAACSCDDVHTEEASQSGELYTWTVVRELGGHREGFVPYVVGQVDLAGGPRVMGVINCDPDAPTIGMPVELCLVPQGTDDDGNERVGYGFEPADMNP